MATAAERYDRLSREVKTVSVGILDHEIPANPKWTILLDYDFDWIIHTIASSLLRKSVID